MQAFNSVKMNEDETIRNIEELKESGNSSASIDQNIVHNLMKRSNSNSNSNNRSSDQISKLSSISDINKNSNLEGLIGF